VNIYLDTSVLVAAALERHPHNVPAAAILTKVRKKELAGWVSAHGLAELYAVPTRVPRHFRELAPAMADRIRTP